MPAKLRAAIPQFTVPDVVQTAEYYRDVLGFTIAGYWKDPPVFAIVARDEVEFFFNQATPGTAPRTGRISGGDDVYVRVDDVDALASEFAPRGATIVEGPETRDYGMRELIVRDYNGLVIAFGQTLATA